MRPAIRLFQASGLFSSSVLAVSVASELLTILFRLLIPPNVNLMLLCRTKLQSTKYVAHKFYLLSLFMDFIL